MADVKTWVPEGFTTGRHPLVSERLGREIDRLGERGGPLRVALHARPGASTDEIETFLSEHPSWQPWRLLPDVWELHVLPGDVAALTARDDLFARVDAAGRLSGSTPVLEGTAAVRIVPTDADTSAVEAAVREAGGTVAGSGSSGVLARMPAERVGTVLALDTVEAIEVMG